MSFETIRPLIEFIDVSDHYDRDEDLVCKFKSVGYEPQEGDRVAIFKIGWTYLKDQLVSQKVERLETPSFGTHCVVFHKSKLPKNETELYQLCYTNGKNKLCGASSSFCIARNPKRLFEKTFQDAMVPEKISPHLHREVFQRTLKASRWKLSLKNEKIQKLKGDSDFIKRTFYPQDFVTLDPSPDSADTKLRFDCIEESLREQEERLELFKLRMARVEEEYEKIYNEHFLLKKKYLEASSSEGLKNLARSSEKLDQILVLDLGELESLPPFPLEIVLSDADSQYF